MCAFKADSVACNALATIVGDIVPSPLRNDTLRVESRSSYLVSYGNKKAIQNLVIRNEGSWLAVIGTPLLRLRSEDQELSFLADFLASPVDSLRHKIDG